MPGSGPASSCLITPSWIPIRTSRLRKVTYDKPMKTSGILDACKAGILGGQEGEQAEENRGIEREPVRSAAANRQPRDGDQPLRDRVADDEDQRVQRPGYILRRGPRYWTASMKSVAMTIQVRQNRPTQPEEHGRAAAHTARCRNRGSRCRGSRERLRQLLTIDLAVGRCWEFPQEDESARHHVVREPGGEFLAQALGELKLAVSEPSTSGWQMPPSIRRDRRA